MGDGCKAQDVAAEVVDFVIDLAFSFQNEEEMGFFIEFLLYLLSVVWENICMSAKWFYFIFRVTPSGSTFFLLVKLIDTVRA